MTPLATGVPPGRAAVSPVFCGSGMNATALLLSSISADGAIAAATGIGELDRVLGGGLVAGSVTVLGGEPGVGKSTLVLQALASLAARGRTSLLIGRRSPASRYAAAPRDLAPRSSIASCWRRRISTPS